MQVLPRPVFRLDGLYGNLFICQQRDQVFAGGTACGKNGRGLTAEVSNGARHVDTATAGLKDRGATAQFTFRVNLRRQGGGIKGRGERQGVDRNHHYLLLAWVPFSLAPFVRKAT